MDAPAAEVWGGALSAWLLQTASFWPLWRRPERGERALRVWVAGIGARVAGLGVVAGGALLSARDAEAAALAYALTVMVLLWLEGWWLIRGLSNGKGGGSASGVPPFES